MQHRSALFHILSQHCQILHADTIEYKNAYSQLTFSLAGQKLNNTENQNSYSSYMVKKDICICPIEPSSL